MLQTDSVRPPGSPDAGNKPHRQGHNCTTNPPAVCTVPGTLELSPVLQQRLLGKLSPTGSALEQADIPCSSSINTMNVIHVPPLDRPGIDAGSVPTSPLLQEGDFKVDLAVVGTTGILKRSGNPHINISKARASLRESDKRGYK